MKSKILGFFALFLLGFGVMSAYLYLKPQYTTYDLCGKTPQGKVCVSDFKGKNVLVYFGYTFCPDVCPITLSLISDVFTQAQEHGEIDLADFVLMFVTLDPLRDSPQDTQEYVSHFFPHSYGLWLPEDELAKLAPIYKLKYQKIALPNSAMQYSIAHTSNIAFFDSTGKFYSILENPTFESLHTILTSLSTPKTTDTLAKKALMENFLDTTTLEIGDKPLFLFFGSQWCVHCQKLLESLHTHTALQELLQTKFRAHYIDIAHPHLYEFISTSKDSVQNLPKTLKTNELMTRYNVLATPTLVILDSHAEVLQRLIGDYDASVLFETLQNILVQYKGL